MDIVVTKADDKLFQIAVPNTSVTPVEVPFRKNGDLWLNVGAVQIGGFEHPTCVTLLTVEYDGNRTVVQFAEPIQVGIDEGFRIEAGQIALNF